MICASKWHTNHSFAGRNTQQLWGEEEEEGSEKSQKLLYKICGWHFNPSCFLQELETLNYQLRDERDHCDRLEDQIRDLTELHQHEIISIRAGVTDMEEKVQYQSEERLLDIREHLQSLENKLTAVEHQV